MNRKSLFLMYYLYREFPTAMPPSIYDEDWLACTVRSIYSPDFLPVTKWLLNPKEVDQHDNLFEIVEKCDAEGYDTTSADLKELVKQVEMILSVNRTVEELCKLKLLALAVCLKCESMIRHLCETLNVNIDWKDLIDIMEIAHQSHVYAPGTRIADGCAFEKSDFDTIYRYLFERLSNLAEIDADGGNVLHFATQNGLGCMAKFLIKHNMVNVMSTNEQNGWNIFNYYASSSRWKCCATENNQLLSCIIKRVLEITSDNFPLSSLTESHKNKIKELCFNKTEGRKSVIHVAVEACKIEMAEYIISCRFGIIIDKREIMNSVERSRYRECYDELIQIAAQLPFNAEYDYLLHRLANAISPENIEHITEQGNVEDHIFENTYRTAIIYRSVSTLEHLITASEDQMNQALAKSTDIELIACMTECIRRNRMSMFKVLVGHYRNLKGIQPRVEVEFENDENDKTNKTRIDEKKMQWAIINKLSEDVAMNQDYLSLLILSVTYGRLLMARFLVEMLQLEINKSSILLIMKVLEKLWDKNYEAASPVYEYLGSRCEANPKLLHLCIQAECYNMLEYLIKEKKLDPNEVDSENGWNVGHYYASDPNRTSGYKEFIWLVEEYNMDCFGVYDRNGRSILYLALENGRDEIVKFIIKHRLGFKDHNQPWHELELEKIEKHIKKLQKILELLPETMPQQKQQVLEDILEKVRDRKIAVTTYKELFTN